ncbi:hypothetical protein BT69DRAFT_1201285, partial [Atractiella rhizophila]
TYDELKSLSLDDPFWNDGFMMCARGLWQTDVITQAGIRTVMERDRAVEELRRMGWEVRRAMAWA